MSTNDTSNIHISSHPQGNPEEQKYQVFYNKITAWNPLLVSYKLPIQLNVKSRH